MDKREEIATRILTTLIMEPAPPEGFDWVFNHLTEHLPSETPHRIKLAQASVLLADTLLECLSNPAEFPADWPDSGAEVANLEPTDVFNDSVSDVEIGVRSESE